MKRLLPLLIVFVSACGDSALRNVMEEPGPPIKAWRVQCETAIKVATGEGKAQSVSKSTGWIEARTPLDKEVALWGFLQDGFVQVSRIESGQTGWSLDRSAPYAELRKLCRDTLDRKNRTRPYRLGLVRAARPGSEIYTSFVFDNWAEREEINRVVVFGDSLSDTGNLRRRLAALPRQPYWLGRFANGPIWTDYLEIAAELAVQNHAVGGAMTDEREALGNEAISQRILTSGQFFVSGSISQQIDEYAGLYLRGQSIQRTDTTVAILWSGANDYISKEAFTDSISSLLNQQLGETGYQEAIDRVVSAMREHLLRLHGLGLEKILVISLPNLGMTPMVLHNKSYIALTDGISEEARIKALQEGLAQLTSRHNDALSAMLGQLDQEYPDLHLTFLDADELLQRVLGQGESLGFEMAERRVTLSEDSRAIQLQDRCYSGPSLGKLASKAEICESAQRAVFWDLVHPSSFFHCWMAFDIADALAGAGWIGSPPNNERREWCEHQAKAF